MQKIFIACVVLFLSTLDLRAQKIPVEQQIIKKIIDLRDFFMSKRFDQVVTIKNNPSWEKSTCDCTEPPPTLEEIQETTIGKPKDVYKNQYPEYVMFHKKIFLASFYLMMQSKKFVSLRFTIKMKKICKILIGLLHF